MPRWCAAPTASASGIASESRRSSGRLQLWKKTTAELKKLGYTVLSSDANFFMVHLRRDVPPVIEAFRAKGVLVGRPFPPMVEHLRVSVGTPEEMQRFLAAFREVIGNP